MEKHSIGAVVVAKTKNGTSRARRASVAGALQAKDILFVASLGGVVVGSAQPRPSMVGSIPGRGKGGGRSGAGRVWKSQSRRGAASPIPTVSSCPSSRTSAASRQRGAGPPRKRKSKR